MARKTDRILAETKYLRFIDRDGWFFVERPESKGVVALLAITDEDRIVLVEQHRPAIGSRVIELPAGLVGDEAGSEAESMETAAERELLEETGYAASGFERIGSAVTAPGLSSEEVTFFYARGLRKVGPGGGVDQEQIRVIEVKLDEVPAWLNEQSRAGAAIAVKVWAGLWFAQERRRRSDAPITGR
jgi:ADP-ribose pyrophosphatase